MFKRGAQYKNRVGEEFKTYQGYVVKVIEYFGCNGITVQFDDENRTILYNVRISNLIRGVLSNPYHPSVCNIGYNGVGEYKTRGNELHRMYYKSWHKMLQRVYEREHKSYRGVVVCEEWHNFQNFAKWFDENWKPWMDSTWVLDKDILCPNCKIYSPETCAFVPEKINLIFVKTNRKSNKLPIGVNKIGKKYVAKIKRNNKFKHLGMFYTPEEAFQVYKTAKEDYIKEVADEWRSLIDLKVYQAMYNYKVE